MISAGDPAIAGDPHQPVGREQQAGFRQGHAEHRGVQRQQQVKDGVARQCQAKGHRGVARCAVGQDQRGHAGFGHDPFAVA
jgi:hypothetical protein